MAVAASAGFAVQPDDCYPSCHQEQVEVALGLVVVHSVREIPIVGLEGRPGRWADTLEDARPAAAAHRPELAGRS